MTSYDDLTVGLRVSGYSRSKSADRWGVEVWSRKGCPAVRVPAECSAAAAERVRHQIETDIAATAMKRKPKRFRARATAAREAEQMEKRRREIEARIEERNRELGGARKYLTSDEAHRIQSKIEADERELRRLKSLMTEIPTTSAHAGRVPARHCS